MVEFNYSVIHVYQSKKLSYTFILNRFRNDERQECQNQTAHQGSV